MKNTPFKSIALTAGGGTSQLNLNDKTEKYVFTGSATLLANWVIEADLSDPAVQPIAGLSVEFVNNSRTIVGANTVNLLGVDITAYILVSFTAHCFYDGSAWTVQVFLTD